MGNIGTGKSSFINRLNRRKGRKAIINDIYPDNSLDFPRDVLYSLNKNFETILEGNYMSKRERMIISRDIRNMCSSVDRICFDFGPGTKETLHEKIKIDKSNKEKTQEIFYKYKNQYSKPTIREGFERIVICY